MGEFSSTKRRIEDVTDDEVKVNINKYREMKDSASVADLIQNTKLSSGSCNRFLVRFKSAETEDLYAKCEYLLFHTEDIALIEWTEVVEPITGNGIGRVLRKEAIEHIGDRTIYTNIVNANLISVAIDQGFRQIQDGALKGWFVLNAD